jgi:hypothetical protein
VRFSSPENLSTAFCRLASHTPSSLVFEDARDDQRIVQVQKRFLLTLIL